MNVDESAPLQVFTELEVGSHGLEVLMDDVGCSDFFQGLWLVVKDFRKWNLYPVSVIH